MISPSVRQAPLFNLVYILFSLPASLSHTSFSLIFARASFSFSFSITLSYSFWFMHMQMAYSELYVAGVAAADVILLYPHRLEPQISRGIGFQSLMKMQTTVMQCYLRSRQSKSNSYSRRRYHHHHRHGYSHSHRHSSIRVRVLC